MSYIKLPIVIEAFRYNVDPRPEWFTEKVSSNDIITHEDYCVIQTPEGNMRADVGMWVIKGIRDEIYPCMPDVFQATYAKVDKFNEATFDDTKPYSQLSPVERSE